MRKKVLACVSDYYGATSPWTICLLWESLMKRGSTCLSFFIVIIIMSLLYAAEPNLHGSTLTDYKLKKAGIESILLTIIDLAKILVYHRH